MMGIEKAAQKLADCMDYPWEFMSEQGRENMRNHVKDILEAASCAPAEDFCNRCSGTGGIKKGGGSDSCPDCNGSGSVIPAEDIRAVVDEPSDAQILEAMRKDIYEADGGYVWDTERDRVLSAGRAVLSLCHPQRSIDVEAIQEIRDRFAEAADLARKAAANCKELNERGAEKTYLKSAAAHDARVVALDAVLNK